MPADDTVFRRVTESDAEARCAAINTKHVSAGLFIEVPVTLADTRAWCNRVQTDPTRRDFCIEQDGQPVSFGGLVNIHARHGTAELYVFTIPGSRRRGHGRHLTSLLLDIATLELNLRKVFLYVSATNEAAIELYGSLGFLLEGTLRSHAWFRGAYRDRHIYAMFIDKHQADPSRLYGAMR